MNKRRNAPLVFLSMFADNVLYVTAALARSLKRLGTLIYAPTQVDLPHYCVLLGSFQSEVGSYIDGVRPIQKACRRTVMLHHGEPLNIVSNVRNMRRVEMVSPAEFTHQSGFEMRRFGKWDSHALAGTFELGGEW